MCISDYLKCHEGLWVYLLQFIKNITEFAEPMLLTDDFDPETYMLKPPYLINVPRMSCSHTKLAIN